MSLKLKNNQRLCSRKDFQYAYHHGHCLRGEWVSLRVAPKARPLKGHGPQIGIVVSRRVSKSAVVRNLWKRRIREILREQQQQLRPENIHVIQARAQKGQPSYGALKKELLTLFEKARKMVWQNS